MRCGSILPVSTGQQIPSRPDWLQLTHAVLQATLQQTPSAQKPEAQSPSFAQAAPPGRGPQLPPTHLTPLAQSVSLRQVVRQRLDFVSQLYGTQVVAGPGLHRP